MLLWVLIGLSRYLRGSIGVFLNRLKFGVVSLIGYGFQPFSSFCQPRKAGNACCQRILGYFQFGLLTNSVAEMLLFKGAAQMYLENQIL